MSDQSYSREELDKMNRLQLRRICKDRGMSSDDAAKAHSDDMIAHILEAQGDDSGKGKTSKKTTSKKTTKKDTKKDTTAKGGAKGKDKLAAKRGRKPPSRGTKAKDPEPVEDPEESTVEATGEVGIDLSEILTYLAEMREEMQEELGKMREELEKRIDTIGNVVDQNFQDLTGDVGELRVDTHQLKAGQVHTYKHFQADELLTDSAAPDGMDIDDVFAAAEEECGGNEEPSADE